MVFADVSQLRISRWYHFGLTGWVLNPMTSVLVREKRGRFETYRREVMCLEAEGHQGLLEPPGVWENPYLVIFVVICDSGPCTGMHWASLWDVPGEPQWWMKENHRKAVEWGTRGSCLQQLLRQGARTGQKSHLESLRSPKERWRGLWWWDRKEGTEGMPLRSITFWRENWQGWWSWRDGWHWQGESRRLWFPGFEEDGCGASCHGDQGASRSRGKWMGSSRKLGLKGSGSHRRRPPGDFFCLFINFLGDFKELWERRL